MRVLVFLVLLGQDPGTSAHCHVQMLPLAEEVPRIQEAFKKDDCSQTCKPQKREGKSCLLGMAKALQGVEGRKRQRRLSESSKKRNPVNKRKL